MINKIVHFSDLHLRLFKDHEIYKLVLTQALDQWKEVKPDRIIFTGDLVHSKNQLTPELIQMVSWLLTECSQISKTIVILGNHDLIESNLERLDALSPIINSLDNPNIVFLTKSELVDDENIRYAVYAISEHNKPPVFDDNKKFTIGLFHGPISGLKTDLGYEFGEEAYDVKKFEGCNIVLCGDIHKRSVFNYPGGKGYMIGSTIQQNYGETLNKHGYGVYTIDNDKYEFVDLENPKPFLSFKIKSFEDIYDGSEKLANI
jgi:DNA repair exonuclease SbcCD nuclease subunit